MRFGFPLAYCGFPLMRKGAHEWGTVVAVRG
jgi:hypothetical protein